MYSCAELCIGGRVRSGAARLTTLHVDSSATVLCRRKTRPGAITGVSRDRIHPVDGVADRIRIGSVERDRRGIVYSCARIVYS